MTNKKTAAVSSTNPLASPLTLSKVPLAESFEANMKTIKQIAQTTNAVQLFGNWNIGQLVHKMREQEGKYGANVVGRAAEELERDPRLLYDALKLYEMHPTMKLVKELEKAKVSWSSSRVLVSVKEPERRAEIVGIVKKRKGTVSTREFQSIVRTVKESTPVPPKPRKAPKKRSDLELSTEYILSIKEAAAQCEKLLQVPLRNMEGEMRRFKKLSDVDQATLLLEHDNAVWATLVSASTGLSELGLGMIAGPFQDVFGQPRDEYYAKHPEGDFKPQKSKKKKK